MNGPQGPQEDDPPQLALIVKAAENLADIIREPDRSSADVIRAVDALGRALVRCKEWLRDEPW